MSDEPRYILKPAHVHGPDFPGKTFRVLMEKETAKFGEYRARRLVLEAADKLGAQRMDSETQEQMRTPESDQTGKSFEKRVAYWFSLLGYKVDLDISVAGRQIDIYAEDRSGPITRKYIVECKDQATPVTTAQYDAFRGRLNTARQVLDPKLRACLESPGLFAIRPIGGA